MFGNLLNETLTLRKKSTGHLHKFRANVQPSRSLIFTDNARLPVEEGDSIDRALSTSVETYTVVERGYYQAVNGIPAHYQMKVRKNIGGESKTPARPLPKTHISKIGGAQTRRENRTAKLRELLDGLSRLRLCGPSDDPDEHTSAIESYRYLLIKVKALSKGLLPRDVSEQLDAVPSNLESIYDVYESKAHLDAVCVDIEAELENPITMPTGSVPAPQPEGGDLEKWHLVLMATEAPTLKDLKALSISKQAQLLLRRLATQYPRSDMTFAKMNFAIQAYAADGQWISPRRSGSSQRPTTGCPLEETRIGWVH